MVTENLVNIGSGIGLLSDVNNKVPRYSSKGISLRYEDTNQ